VRACRLVILVGITRHDRGLSVARRLWRRPSLGGDARVTLMLVRATAVEYRLAVVAVWRSFTGSSAVHVGAS
jgi:hypothetical protein